MLVVIGVIGASPWFLRAFDGPTTRWERLSFIGQTYGAASALLAVLALIGIVATLALQAQDTRIAREEARLRAVSREMFSARPGRAYWRAARGRGPSSRLLRPARS